MEQEQGEEKSGGSNPVSLCYSTAEPIVLGLKCMNYIDTPLVGTRHMVLKIPISVFYNF